jgi:hypothetical protein
MYRPLLPNRIYQGNIRSSSPSSAASRGPRNCPDNILELKVEFWLTGRYTHRAPSQSHKYISDLDLAPRASHESWKFTPPLPDSNSSPATLSNRSPIYSTPPPAEETSTPYYDEDVDLATPEIGVEIGIRTPPLLPTLGDGVHIGWMVDTPCCSPQTAQPYELCHINLLDPPQDSAPCYLLDRPSDFESPDHSTGTPSIGDSHLETEINFDSPVMNISCQTHDKSMLTPLQASTEKCVYILLLILSAAASNHIFKPATDLLLLTDTDFAPR